MKLTPRQRHQHRRDRSPRVSISQAEITADLLYPASPRQVPSEAMGRTRGPRR